MVMLRADDRVAFVDDEERSDRWDTEYLVEFEDV